MQPKKSSKKTLKFQASHEEKFGLKITAGEPESGVVSSCVCRLCTVFGEKVDAKRKSASRAKYFDCFRTDHYLQNLQQQHPLKWAEYDDLQSSAERYTSFKEVTVPFVNSLDAHIKRNGALHFTVIVTSCPAMAMCAIGYAGPPPPSKLRMYRALATRAGVPRSRP
jgi:hypothetical protein